MTTPTKQFSPFQNNSSSDQEKKPAEDFSIRTMQDDFDLLQKNGTLSTEKGDALVTNEKLPPANLPTSSTQKEAAPKTANPFLDQNPIPSPIPAETEKKPLQTSHPAIDLPTEKNSSSASNEAKPLVYKIFLIIIFILIISILGFSAYYFWMTKTPTTVSEDQSSFSAEQDLAIDTTQIQQEPEPEEEPVIIEAPLEKYSADKPNYLTLDIVSPQAEDVKIRLINLIDELKTSVQQKPYEFIVVDKNNTPISFPIFAIASKLKLSPKVLSNFGENFSIFIYNDNGNFRVALAISIKSKTELAKELTLEEKTLITDASFLFLDSKPEITVGAFNSSTYKEMSIRYFNVNTPKNLSIDYCLLDSKLIIATSKNTLRATLDILQSQSESVNPSKTIPTTTETIDKKSVSKNLVTQPAN